MAEKPRHASEYKSEQVELVRATCLYVATKLGDLMDELVIIGGLEPDFAAMIAPGLPLAFQDRRRITLEGRTVFGEKATREVWACDAGAFVVLKALAFAGRGENKDAYDLHYVIRNYGVAIDDVAARLRPLQADAQTQ